MVRIARYCLGVLVGTLVATDVAAVERYKTTATFGTRPSILLPVKYTAGDDVAAIRQQRCAEADGFLEVSPYTYAGWTFHVTVNDGTNCSGYIEPQYSYQSQTNWSASIAVVQESCPAPPTASSVTLSFPWASGWELPGAQCLSACTYELDLAASTGTDGVIQCWDDPNSPADSTMCSAVFTSTGAVCAGGDTTPEGTPPPGGTDPGTGDTGTGDTGTGDTGTGDTGTGDTGTGDTGTGDTGDTGDTGSVTGALDCDVTMVCEGDAVACQALEVAKQERCDGLSRWALDAEAVNEMPTIAGDPSLNQVVGLDNMLTGDHGWLGGMGCPSPRTVSALGATLEFSYQPICTLAGWLSALVLVIAGMIAMRVVGEGF